ncbi:MAG: hypothetical protein EZS28_035389 [Streblomastix strix]|uniref:Uncharacterized protein n=1 Tax=Streblomastix strix TaxID=222440 RepID=A0A5J4UFQ5_9EUKA|nr:MAG: hypothetical protein EZS28_035389 [Streblomastix strix]
MYIYYFSKLNTDETEIFRTSSREQRRMKRQYEDIQINISILRENVHRILVILITKVDESGAWSHSDGGFKHFFILASIIQDVSSYGVDRAEGRISVSAVIILSSECTKLHIAQGKYVVVCSSGT